MDVSPLAGVSHSAGTGEYEYLGRARTLKAIAALIGVMNVDGLLSGLISIGVWAAGLPFEHSGIAWMLGGTFYSAAMCLGVVLLWKLHPTGLLVILGWVVSLSFTLWFLCQTAGVLNPEGEESETYDTLIKAIALCQLPLIAYLTWLLISSRTRAVVFRNNREWLQRESGLAGTTIAALVLIGLVFTSGFVQEVVSLFA